MVTDIQLLTNFGNVSILEKQRLECSRSEIGSEPDC